MSTHARLFALAALAVSAAGTSLIGCQSTNPRFSLSQVDSGIADAAPDGVAACAEGTGCEDGDPCTIHDTCSGGRCVGTAKDCNDNDTCTSDVCDLANGTCEHAPSGGTGTEGPPGDPSCSNAIDDDCDGRADSDDPDCRTCEAAGDCPEATACATAACERGRCVESPARDGQACRGVDKCSQGGACQAGQCVGQSRTCPEPENPCLVATCDAASGGCGVAPAPAETQCDDGDACTVDDTCIAGVCGGAPMACGALDGACVIGICAPEAGGCMAVPRDDGTPCGGDDRCLVAGTCASGRCTGEVTDCHALDGTCRVGLCDPATGGCGAVQAEDGTACDDGDPCTVDDACGVDGACLGHALDCGVLTSACAAGRCDPATGACVADPVPNGAPCEDGQLCTEGDTCQSGLCTGTPRPCEGTADGCQVGVCDEATGACALAPALEGTPCDDNNLCTTGDVCVGGACGAAAVDCLVPGACYVAACEPANGACLTRLQPTGGAEGAPGDAACQNGVDDDCDGAIDAADPDCRTCLVDADCNAEVACHTFVCADNRCVDAPAPAGTPCDDGNACTRADACDAGRCVGAAVDCSAFGSPCTAGVCDVATGACVAAPRVDGVHCDDRDPCTLGDVCQAGLCQGEARSCAPLDTECARGACVAATGACVAQSRGDGTPCNDGDLCTTADVCTDGACHGTGALCEVGTCQVADCDRATGACHTAPAPEGAGCDDGDPCTELDSCSAGICAGHPKSCAALDAACVVGACEAGTGECRAVPRLDRTPCDDGSLCTAGEACLGGVCVGALPDCSALDGACTAGACDPQTGRCVATPVENGRACDDGDLCTATDVCTDGACHGSAADCGALNSACTAGRCDPATGACVSDGVHEGLGCDDGNPCTAGDTCSVGHCQGQGQDCSALTTPCTVGACDAAGACVAVPRDDGTACASGDLCAEAGVCAAGTCVAPPKDCSALTSPCADGICDPRNGNCVAEARPDLTPCDDGNVCTLDEACHAGQCQGRDQDCSGLTTNCTVGVCDPATADGCVARPVADGIACASGNLCQVAEACQAGRCSGSPRVCPPAGACQVQVCDPNTGACAVANAPDGTACDDGRFCNSGETCTRGVCGGGGPRDCNPPGEPCKRGTCDEENDRCNVQNLQDRTPCDDGQFCTTNEFCNAGVCRAFGQRSCPDANLGCQVGVCNEAADRCDLANAFDYKPCLDGRLCTVGDHCEGGVCVYLANNCN